MARFDLNGTWNMVSVEGIDGFLADSGASWLKRKAAAQVLGGSRNPRRFEQRGNAFKSAVRRKGTWKEDEFIADGERVYGEETNGVRMWQQRYWDSDGWLVDEGQNHEGHLRTRFGLLDPNTMQMRVAFVLDPLSGNEMVRVYSRDGAALPTNAPIPRCAPEAPPENVEPSAPGTELTPTEVSAGEKDIRHRGDDAMALEDEVDSAEIAAAVAGPTEQSWAGGAAAGATVAAASGCKEPTGSAREDSSKIRSSPPTHPPPVVFIHGIMGSTLEDGSGSTQFLTVPHVLGLHSPSLALPTNWTSRGPQHRDTHKDYLLNHSAGGEQWVQASDGLHPGEVLRHVGPVAVYGPFLEWLVDTVDDATTFSYDWRRDNNESADRFICYLEQIKQRHAGRPPQVIAHSNGGLVSLVALNERPDLFHSVLFCGVPFGPGCSYVEDMHTHGKQKYGLNTSMLKPDVMCTHASYLAFFATSLLAEGEEFARSERTDTRLIGPDGEEIDPIGDDCTDSYGGAWERFGLGPFRANGDIARLPEGGSRERRLDESRRHLAHATTAARRFRQRLRGRSAEHYRGTPLGILNSRAFQTKTRGHVKVQHDRTAETTLSYELGEGDGSVAYAMSFLPRSCGTPAVHYESKANHLGIMSDFEGIGHCMLRLQEAAASKGRGGVSDRLRVRTASMAEMCNRNMKSAHASTPYHLYDTAMVHGALLACTAVLVVSWVALLE